MKKRPADLSRQFTWENEFGSAKKVLDLPPMFQGSLSTASILTVASQNCEKAT